MVAPTLIFLTGDMATLAEVQADIAALQAAVTDANVKMDMIVTLVEQLRAGVGGVTPADLDGLRSGLASVVAVLAEVASKQDAVLA